MARSKWTLAGAVLAALGLLAPAAPGDPRSGPSRIAGAWATEGFGAIVDLETCESDGTADHVCGRIRWLWDGRDSQGRPRLDEENPEALARSRPLVGVEVLRNFRETAPGLWTGGSVYNPEDGRTYSGTLELRPDGVLELEGCAFRIFCARTVWRRPADLLDSAGLR
jgi:uncharacterized protein (DUF2147 family)